VKTATYYSRPRTKMAAYLPHDVNVCLDVGCGAGGFAQLLKASHPDLEIWGVEIESAIAAEATPHMARVLVGDVLSLADKLPDNYFDCIFFNDSLEHMVDPYSALRILKSKLKTPSGKIIASIPNIRHYQCLYNLLIKKDWRYVEAGVMDSTHLRFFTKKSIRRLFEEAGYKVEKLEGLSGSRKLRARIWGWITFGWMDDVRYKQFACVAALVQH